MFSILCIANRLLHRKTQGKGIVALLHNGLLVPDLQALLNIFDSVLLHGFGFGPDVLEGYLLIRHSRHALGT